MRRRRLYGAVGALLAAVAVTLLPLPTAPQAQAAPVSGVIYELGNTPCLKGRGNCAIYPKATQLPGGRLLVAFELATVVPASQGAAGETVPVYKSDDNGESWQLLSQVRPPSASGDPAVARYTSNWTNPYLYVLPQAVGQLPAGTLLMATVVSGEDEYYKERKAADPNWVPSNDGDRRNLAIALYSSTNQGADWTFRNIITTGGWQGGSAGAIGGNVAAVNTTRQIDPVWEPFLMVHNNRLVAYYSDENDYVGYDRTTGAPTLDPANGTASDAAAQILAHRTWDGTSAGWSSPVVDEAGLTIDRGNGKTQIGGGRPGMTTVAPTTDGRWIMTYEYFGGGSVARYKISSDPLRFFAAEGRAVGELPTSAGSSALHNGGSPVTTTLPDGRIVYNADGSGDVWLNSSGRSDGRWTRLSTPVGSGYSRTMLNLRGTDRLLLFQGVWGGATAGSTIRYGEVDLATANAPAARPIRNMSNGLCLDDFQFNTQPGAEVRQWACTGQANQAWSVRPAANGTSTIVNAHSGLCLDDFQFNTQPGAEVRQWTCTGQANQAWTVRPAANGASTIVNLHSGLCLDNFRNGTANGSEVRQSTCNGQTNQLWTIG